MWFATPCPRLYQVSNSMKKKHDLNKLVEMEVPEFAKWFKQECKKNEQALPLTIPDWNILAILHLKQIRNNVRKLTGKTKN